MKGLDVNSNGVVSLDLECTLSQKQIMALKSMPAADKTKYILSIMGISTSERLYVPRYRIRGTDRLQTKEVGSVLNQFKQLINPELTHNPLRQDVGHWVGVEIECFVPNTERASGFNQQRRRLEGLLRAAKVKRVNVKHDGSLSPGGDDSTGMELTLLLNTKYGLQDLSKLCGVLHEVGAYVNKSCGLHVHLDARQFRDGREVKTFGSYIERCLPVLQHMIPTSRRDNSYCKYGMSSSVSGDRYYMVNLAAWERYGTVEVRMHGGSVDFPKIANWISLLKSIVNAKPQTTVRTFQAFIDATNLPDALVAYCEKRIEKFTPGFTSPNIRQVG